VLSALVDTCQTYLLILLILLIPLILLILLMRPILIFAVEIDRKRAVSVTRRQPAHHT